MVKIADFGRAMFLKEEQKAKGRPSKIGTIRYTAPEVARAQLKKDNSKKDLTTAIDVNQFEKFIDLRLFTKPYFRFGRWAPHCTSCWRENTLITSTTCLLFCGSSRIMAFI